MMKAVSSAMFRIEPSPIAIIAVRASPSARMRKFPVIEKTKNGLPIRMTVR